jgi:hypothetical protein
MAKTVTTALLLALASAGVADAGRVAPKGAAVAATPPPSLTTQKPNDHAKLSATSEFKATALNDTRVAPPPSPPPASSPSPPTARAPATGFVARANASSLQFSLGDHPFIVTGANQCASRACGAGATARRRRRRRLGRHSRAGRRRSRRGVLSRIRAKIGTQCVRRAPRARARARRARLPRTPAPRADAAVPRGAARARPSPQSIDGKGVTQRARARARVRTRDQGMPNKPWHATTSLTPARSPAGRRLQTRS